MSQFRCPVCQRQPRDSMTGKLYGRLVCHDCRADLETRRGLAFFFDYVVFSCLVGVLTLMLVLGRTGNTDSLTFVSILFHMIAGTLAFSLAMIFGNILIPLLLLTTPVGLYWQDHVILLVLGRFALLPILMIFRDQIAGTSPGKWLAGIQTLDVRSLKSLGWWQAIKRNVWMLLPCSSILGLWRLRQGWRLGDRWAKTMVVFRKADYRAFFLNYRFCGKCHYDLTGNTSGTCPECGKPVPVSLEIESVQQ